MFILTTILPQAIRKDAQTKHQALTSFQSILHVETKDKMNGLVTTNRISKQLERERGRRDTLTDRTRQLTDEVLFPLALSR